MKNEIYRYLKFKIGEESYDRGWEIIPIPPYVILENKLSLESYEYFGEINEILGYKTSQIILYYNADILMRVEVLYRGDLTKALVSELNNLKIMLPTNLSILINYVQDGDLTLLLYQNKILLQNST
jgi:hypothetical protein